MTQDKMKQAAAMAALEYVQPDTVVGVGTGSTVKYFIEALADIKHQIEGVVSSSEQSSALLKAHGIPVLDVNSVSTIPVYIDSADEANHHLQLIKGGGAALTREKIIAAISKQFVCVIDQSKWVPRLGKFPLPVEVVPMARSYVAREIVKLGGDPNYRTGVVTDNGNVILDVENLDIINPIELEAQLNNIVGVVTNGLFAKRPADILLKATPAGVETITV